MEGRRELVLGDEGDGDLAGAVEYVIPSGQITPSWIGFDCYSKRWFNFEVLSGALNLVEPEHE